MANQLRWKYWIFIFSIATLPAPEGCGFVLSLGFRTDTAKESSKRTCPRPLVQHHPKPKLWLKVLELCYWKYAVTVGSWWLICTPTWCNLALPYLASAASTPLQGVMLQAPSAVMTGYRAALCASIYQFQTSVGNITNLLWNSMLFASSYCACCAIALKSTCTCVSCITIWSLVSIIQIRQHNLCK